MGRLVYVGIGSLDGYVADVHGDFGWSQPDEEVHSFINVRTRDVSAELYGRRLYEVMKVWETLGNGPDDSPVERQFAQLWRSREKVVFSSSLEEVTTSRTTLNREFIPNRVRAYVDEQPADVSIGGPELAARALEAGIVDVLEYYAHPVVLGAGKPWLPSGVRIDLTLLETRRFTDGVVYLAYRVDPG